jgi:hypothetical protein
MTSKTLIQYRADSFSASGWEDRKLMPQGSLTSLLWETIDYSGRLPAPGDRVRNYRQDETTGQITDGRNGDWVVTTVQHFSSFDTNDRIIICYCQYQPIEANWQPINRGLPVSEVMQREPAS